MGNKKTAAGTRQRRQLPQEGHHIQAQGAVTPPPPGLSLDFGELSRATEAFGVCKPACGRQPAAQAMFQVRR